MPRAPAPPAPQVRIADVARRARVSTGTVSHVLSGRTQVSDALRRRVEKAIDALGYVPNFHAQGLRRKLSRVVGLCLPHTSTAYLNALSETLEGIAASAGYGVMHVFSRHDPDTEHSRLEDLIRYRVDGLILLPSTAPARALDLAARKALPLVIIDRPTRDKRFDQVILDNRASMREVAAGLVALGHARLLFVCHSRSRLVTQHRVEGLEATRRAHPGLDIRTIEFQGDDAYLASELARAMKDASPPTAIVASNSHQASLVLGALAGIGVACPDDVSVVTFDDPEWSTLVQPPLSVVRQPAAAMARAAWDLLMQRVNGERVAPRTIMLRAAIDLRASVGPPRARPGVVDLARATRR
ncbi:MAG TPA: LacI family DNA-binding transcriptional regulator [Casimicrobiaceae bacterium]